jgi:hypothetical protein
MAVWSMVKMSALAGGLRLDAEYYQPHYLADARRLAITEPESIGSFAVVTDGIHASPDEVEEGGVRYLSAKCVKDNSFALGDALQISESQHAATPRTSLRENDVLITTTGTIGNAAVVQRDILPSNSDRHLGIVRIRPAAGVDPYYLATFLNCEYGRFQSLREATGNVQLNLFIEKIRELRVPILACAREVAEQTRAAYDKRRQSKEAISAAEEQLMEVLGLEQVDMSPHRFYTRRFADLRGEGRFDAEYFSPKYQRIINRLREGHCKLADIATLSERPFNRERRTSGATFRYIEIGSLTGHGEAEPETLDIADAPSRAAWIVKPGDIITSTVRPIRRLSALIRDDQDACVCSSGFAVLTPRTGADCIEPEVLLTYLRLPVICEILDLHTTASMYPAIHTDSLLSIPFVIPDKTSRAQIVAKVSEAMASRREAALLLEQARKLVEAMIASETGGEGK